jgi:predicted O-linked N-acetylglucosamine transferase (SPINDLY family)
MKWLAKLWPSLASHAKANVSGDREQLALSSIERGNALEDAGLLEQAMQCYESAIITAPHLARAHLSRGNILLATGSVQAALAAYSRALALNPQYAPAHYNAGNAYLHLASKDKALSSYARAIELSPEFADAHVALGGILVDLNRFAEAEACYRQALIVQPTYAPVHCNLANILAGLGRFEDALASYQRAIELAPEVAQAHQGLAHTLEQLGRFDEVVIVLQRALDLTPGSAEAHHVLASALMTVGRVSDAISLYQQALVLDPMHSTARWAMAMALLRPIYNQVTDVDDAGVDFSRAIAELGAWFTPSRASMGAKAVGTKTPFYLAYHARNNRVLLEAYGRLCSRLMTFEFEPMPKKLRLPPLNTRKLRIGVVSAHVWNHSVWIAITRGWIEHLNPSRFEVLVFHLSSYGDEETARARRESTDFIDSLRTVDEWSKAILSAQLDVLIFPEIGMDALTTQLAARRLVPVQLTSWGHPQTSGLPTIDIFLSADLFEPPHAQTHYCEKLVRLPNLGVCVEPLAPRVTVPDLSSMGLPINGPLLLCPGSPFKYSPEHDEVWVELGRRLQTQGRGCLVFFESQRTAMNEQFFRRLRGAFAQANVDFDQTVRQVPTLPRDQFYGLMQSATLMLDTIEFSGFNTAIQGLECGLPMIAYEGEFMRGRLASGLLRRLDMDEWIATSKSEFIEKTIRLVVDEPLRRNVRERITQCRAILFNDLAPVRALEQVLEDAVASSLAYREN